MRSTLDFGVASVGVVLVLTHTRRVLPSKCLALISMQSASRECAQESGSPPGAISASSNATLPISKSAVNLRFDVGKRKCADKQALSCTNFTCLTLVLPQIDFRQWLIVAGCSFNKPILCD
uniref:Secreted protein n=1 Tax=Trichuris muris TaxID=70415 RepID=A0A5S6QYZ3_TRIMR